MEDLALHHHRYLYHGETGSQWALLTPPAQEPITVLDARQQARFTQPNNDALFDRYIRAAREEAEEYMARGLFTQTWQFTLRHFSDEMYLPRAAPLQSVSSVQYYDTTGALQTAATSLYTVDTISRPGRILRAMSQTWPSLRPEPHAGRVVITYVVGWTDIALIPERIKQGIRMYVAYLECDREGLEVYGEKARMAAQACWSDRVEWIEPVDRCRV